MTSSPDLPLFFVTSLVSLFSIVDPPMAAPVFASLTQDMSPQEQKQLAKRVSFFVLAILVAFFAAGGLILAFFGISIDALRIAGGLMILGTAYNMLEKKDRINPEEEQEAHQREDIAFSPLAMPILSGPGAIAVLIGMTTNADSWAHFAVILLVILLVCWSCYWTLVLAPRMVNALGQTVIRSFTRIMGFILLCIGVQYIVNGVRPILTSVFHP
jgi:multiple antibiotic resistance protein